MRYSLLDRFQGAWFGSLLDRELSKKKSLLSVDGHSLPWWEIGSQIASLIPFSTTDSLLWEQWIYDLNSHELILNDLPTKNTNDKKQKVTSSDIILLALPIILYYHDNWGQLKKILNRSISFWDSSSGEIEDVLIWSYILSLTLREKFVKDYFLIKLLVDLEIKDSKSLEIIHLLDRAFVEGWSVKNLQQKLLNDRYKKKLPVYLSLYCFASTGEDFGLTIIQATKLQQNSSNFVALTATLTGAYNGINNIPNYWRKSLSKQQNYQNIMYKSYLLFNNWSGVYSDNLSLNLSEVVSSCGTIQKRSSLKIISQI